MQTLRVPILLVLLGLYMASLCLPVMTLGDNPGETWPGFAVLVTGWLGILFLQFGWLANLFLIPVFILLGMRQVSLGPAVLLTVPLLLLGVDALTWSSLYNDNGVKLIQSYGAGYYLWIAVVMSSGPLLILRAVAEAQPQPAIVRG